jgi:hypothetical protein
MMKIGDTFTIAGNNKPRSFWQWLNRKPPQLNMYEVLMNMTSKPDTVNNPKHYNSHPSGVECIQITEHMNFNLGNAVKYLWRTDHKNGIEDLKKAVWYINREIKRLSK